MLISGILTDLIEKKEISEAEIIIPEFAVEELRAQASRGREIGFKGLEEATKKNIARLIVQFAKTKARR